MKTIPDTVEVYSKSPVFNQDTIPDRLRKNHHTQEDFWAKIIVKEGELLYYIDDQPEPIRLTQDLPGVIEPKVPHRVDPADGGVKFYIEFYK